MPCFELVYRGLSRSLLFPDLLAVHCRGAIEVLAKSYGHILDRFESCCSSICFSGMFVVVTSFLAWLSFTRRISEPIVRLKIALNRFSRIERDVATTLTTSQTCISWHACSRMNFTASTTSLSSMASTSVECLVATPTGSMTYFRGLLLLPDIKLASTVAAWKSIL